MGCKVIFLSFCDIFGMTLRLSKKSGRTPLRCVGAGYFGLFFTRFFSITPQP
jgi:hypothetical protein